MIERIVNLLKGKKIAILGFGREGVSSYEFITKYVDNPDITVIDKDTSLLSKYDYLNESNCVLGDNYLDNLKKYDLIIKTPGISLKDIDITGIKDRITSQVELLLKANKEKVIGVTGTKGKSTTSSLIYEIIKDQNENTILVGNIGLPILSNIENCDEDTIIVAEMSSHQLEYIDVSPRIGVILNLFEDHLDHAGTVEHYHDIKLNMFRYQNDNDYMIYCSNNETLDNLIKKNNFKGIKYTVNPYGSASITIKDNYVVFNDTRIYDINSKRNLLGKHNLENIMTALTVAIILNLDIDRAISVINTFKGLPYRLENIGTVDEVTYYTDTLATIPEATEEATKSLNDIDTLIFGGMDRGISYEGFADYLNSTNIRNFICMPETGHTIGKDLINKNVYFVETLEEAVKKAKEVTAKGKICLLSPAASSYNSFKNYAEKGDKFKELVYDK